MWQVEDFQSLSKTCNIGSGSYLHFYNYEPRTIYISFKMYDNNPHHWPDVTWDPEAFQYDATWLADVWSMFH